MYNLQGAISGAVGAVKGAALRIASNIESSFLGLPGRVVSIGRNIVQGIANGIAGAAGVVVNKLTGVVGGAINAAKNLLGIHSPSRVFRKMFGYVMEGAALGIDDTADMPVRSMRSAVSAVEEAASFDATVRAEASEDDPDGNGGKGSPRYGGPTMSRVVELLERIADGGDVYMDGDRVSGALAGRSRTTMLGRGCALA